MTTTFLFNDEAKSYAEVLQALPDKEFASPTRSTVPLLAWWNTNTLSAALVGEGAVSTEVEARVASAKRPNGGANTASFTDIMVRSETRAVAVEGKWTEPRYPTVDAWLGTSPSPNKLGVLDHWLALIAPFCDSSPTRANVGGCTYQMLHRAASACAQGLEPTMLYQVFGTEHRARYEAELTEVLDALRPSGLRICLMLIPIDTTRSWAALQRREPSTVRQAMVSEELFRFGTPDLIDIGGRG